MLALVNFPISLSAITVIPYMKSKDELSENPDIELPVTPSYRAEPF
jgi:hypothetical protein